ncbi:alpha/beta hydrolase [Bradyrhizobium sp.]|jgi:pimeloyl-ACP methyl ester carboxylesterase|uniref:alpha/beta fold hydrolase n=1 Tax=Bradyrhizobium sp. TaxID=376 RepID=UPI002E0ABBB5|nr:alpha/beta hydrolase [Bradyrhizobium sp.]
MRTKAAAKSQTTEDRIFGILGMTLRAIDTFSTQLSSRFLYWLWGHPIRHKPSAREMLFKKEAEVGRFESNGVTYNFYSAGKGPAVLAVHGWDGRGTQMLSFFQPLVDAGFKIVTFDAHGHGESPGRQANGVVISDMIVELSNKVGGFDAIIAHSIGGSFALVALERISTKKVVLIAPPQSMESSFQKIKKRLGVPDGPEKLFRERFERNFKNSWNRFSIDQLVTKIPGVKGLIIQDEDDDFVDPSEAQAIHERWDGAEIFITKGHGHRKILRAPEVVKKAVSFIAS